MAMAPTDLDFDSLRPPCSVMTVNHDVWRERVRLFVEETIRPNLKDWDKEGTFPDSVYLDAVDSGLFGIGFPESLGGQGTWQDIFYRVIFAEEMHRLGSGVVFADLATHWIGLPPVIEFGNAELRESVGKAVLSGQKKIAFAVTEPSGGSDAANLTTSATVEVDAYRVSGTKTLISGGMRADFILTAVRTGDKGARGISLLLIDADSEGVSRNPVEGLCWYNANTATIHFDDVIVGKERLVGVENQGFAALASQFNVERFSGVGAALGLCRAAVAEAINFSRQRATFGRPLVERQVVKHKLVELVRQIHTAYAYLDVSASRFTEGSLNPADLAMLKITAVNTLQTCSKEALHLVGGSAYSGNYRLERIYRESRIFALGGGTDEVLRDFTARQLGI